VARARIDMDRSTPYALFLDDYTLGTTRMITVAALQRLLQERWPPGVDEAAPA